MIEKWLKMVQEYQMGMGSRSILCLPPMNYVSLKNVSLHKSERQEETKVRGRKKIAAWDVFSSNWIMDYY